MGYVWKKWSMVKDISDEKKINIGVKRGLGVVLGEMG